MNSVLIEIGAILLLIGLNGVLSMSEIAVVSARKIRLQQRAEAGVAGAQTALKLASNPGHFLSTVQIGITLIGILAGAFGGATIAEELEVYLSTLPVTLLSKYSEAISVAFVVLIITILSLILGELAPKQIGLNDPEGIAARFAPIMYTLSRVTAPVNRVISAVTSLILRVMGIRPSTEPEVTEEEIKLLIEQGAEGGIFEPQEEELVGQIFKLADRPIVAQMTPRTDIVWLDLNDSSEKMHAVLDMAKFTYYPVARDSIDDLLGVVQTKDLLSQYIKGNPLSLEKALTQPLFLPQSITTLEALEHFRKYRNQIAMIIDEFGGIQGMVTLTDILEAIAGDFPDAMDESDPEIMIREDGSYLIGGMINIDEFVEMFDLKTLPGMIENHYQTLGGFMMAYLGRVPSTGDTLEIERLHLEIVDMDGMRVDKVIVTQLGPD